MIKIMRPALSSIGKASLCLRLLLLCAQDQPDQRMFVFVEPEDDQQCEKKDQNGVDKMIMLQTKNDQLQ